MGVTLPLSGFERALAAGLPAGELRDALETAGLPHRRVEAWKWSDLRAVAAKMDAGAGRIEVRASREANVTATLDRQPELLMPRLAAGLSSGCPVYELTDGETLSLEFIAEAGSSHHIAAIQVPAGVGATLHERYHAAPGSFANLALNIELGEGASLTRVVEQDASPDAVLVVTTGINLAARASLHQTTLGFGAKLARLETHVSHAGEGAELTLGGSYLVGDGLHLDQTGIVRHTGPNGTTRELFKGAAATGGRGVFQGKIHVEQAAQKTDAQMNHRGLLLSSGADIYAKPELEIYADDVVCAHGNALGAVDEEALFYMRQRGLTETRARAVLTRSFLAEPLDAVSNDALHERLLGKLDAALEAVS
ncbi:MAG: SufB/SufD family protein [Caulobacterales bacterium]|uniref:SufB/SufD family protein n=1 Tax=Glycocaulis sp. TaxID=1969725 RepID=UPI003F9EDABE